MSGPFGSSQWMYQSARGFYEFPIEQSLKFNDGDSSYLSRAFSVGNRTTWTLSLWVKLGDLTSREDLFSTALLGYNEGFLAIEPNGRLRFYDYDLSISNYRARLETEGFLRDPSAWYHFAITFDTTNATASERVRMYINGVRQTAFAFEVYPPQNYQGFVNAASIYYIGRTSYNNYLDGYLAEANFIDGQALDPTSFGEFKSGVWIPKQYGGTYGTNGFRLSFADSSNIGDDTSGNTNDWTANNLVATDVLLDSPTNNFAVLNPLAKGTSTTLSEGNLRFTSSTTYGLVSGTIGVKSGKWYWEALIGNTGTGNQVGLTNVNTNPSTYMGLGMDFGYGITGIIYGPNDTVSQSGLTTSTTGDIIGVAMDLDAGEVKFYKNNSLITTVTSVNTSVDRFPAVADNSSGNQPDLTANFGQDSSFAGNKTAQGNTDANGIGDFYYAPPSGYLALCTANLPDPVIDPAQDDVPSDYFNTVLYTGNGSTQSITGVGFQPDLNWVKERSSTSSHGLTDVVRGATKFLYSNLTNAEASDPTFIQSFDTDGFTTGANTLSNESGQTYVAWNWLAGNGTSSNTDGSITSTVSVNQKAGFSIVTYTGNGSSGPVDSVGHGLNSTPEIYFTKRRDAAQDWFTFTNAIDGGWDYGLLNTTAAFASTNQYADSSEFYITGNSTNASGGTYVAYLFHSVEGYSKVGRYTGNGSTDGPFVYSGFRPAWVMLTQSNTSRNWSTADAARSPYNVGNAVLYPNTSSAEVSSGTGSIIDFYSNGFKLRNSGTELNQSGGTYIFLAFAENPFKYANAR